jgi:hypothetical protein
MAKQNLSHALPARKSTVRINLISQPQPRPYTAKMLKVFPSRDELGSIAALIAFIAVGVYFIAIR